MLSGTGNKGLIILTALLIFFSSACSQTKEEKMKLAKQHHQKALEFVFNGNVKSAIQEQLEAIKLDSENAELWVDLIGLYLDDNDLEKAKNSAEKAIQIDSKNAWGHSLYGDILEKLGKDKEGLEHRKLASELDKENPIFLTNYGVALENLGDNNLAKKCYEDALSKNSNFIFALVRLGLLERDLGNIEKATELLEKAIKTTPVVENDEGFIKFASDKLTELKSKNKVENKKP
jgi:tetratricopeptide (TPR) repeat protein